MGCGALSKIASHGTYVDKGQAILEVVGKRPHRTHTPESAGEDDRVLKQGARSRDHEKGKPVLSTDEGGHSEEVEPKVERRRSKSPSNATTDGSAVGVAGVEYATGRTTESGPGNEGGFVSLPEEGSSKRLSITEGSKRRNIKDHYKLGKTLGKGGYAMVKQATSKATGEEFAVKIIRLPSLFHWKGTPREGIFKEVDLLLGMDHPNVVKLYDFFEDGSKVYLVMELLSGGELLTALMKRGTYTEDDARFCFRQIIEGVQYLHSHQIVHRDLKLENVLLVEKDNLRQVKIADFGFAKQVQASNVLSTVCGTPIYVAPEVISNGKYTSAIDMWSAGIILYILLGGYPPFYDESEPALYELIRNTTFSFDDPAWKSVSKSAKNLIQKLLVANPSKRLTATDVLNHRWLNKDKGKNVVVEPEKNLAATMQRLRKHVAINKMRSAVKAIIWLNRLSNAVQLAERTRGSSNEGDEKAKIFDRRSSLPAGILSLAGKDAQMGSSSTSIVHSSGPSMTDVPITPPQTELPMDGANLRMQDLKRTRGSVGPPEILFAIGALEARFELMEPVEEHAEEDDRLEQTSKGKKREGDDDDAKGGMETGNDRSSEEHNRVHETQVSATSASMHGSTQGDMREAMEGGLDSNVSVNKELEELDSGHGKGDGSDSESPQESVMLEESVKILPSLFGRDGGEEKGEVVEDEGQFLPGTIEKEVGNCGLTVDDGFHISGMGDERREVSEGSTSMAQVKQGKRRLGKDKENVL